ncbi:MAG: LacI family DNA-binding transcriptional regulator [Thermotogae bacterium]|nr:LacI family DNA-binding transcriptional regulator [Thermotogota bacterium]
MRRSVTGNVPKNRSVTIETIAKKAGVSKMTVSRAINHPDKVRPETLVKIHEVMRELNYQPRFAARILAGHRSHTIGFIVESSKDFIIPPFYGECVKGASSWLRRWNYRAITFNVADLQGKTLFLDYANSGLIDGLIVFEGTYDKDFLRILEENNIPVVLVGEDLTGTSLHTISCDNYTGAKEAMEYLISKGLKRICHITGTGGKPSYREREMAYVNVMKENGFEPIIIRTSNTFEGGMEAAEKLIKNNPDCEAVFCFSDLLAIGVIRKLADLGISVPAKMKVIGFDNIPLANYVVPSLTTVAQDMQLMGKVAAEKLLHIISGSKPARKHMKIPTRLIVRESA